MWSNGVCNMGLLFLLFILSFALALPNQVPPTAPRPNCIRMTPEKEKQIDTIVEKLGEFLTNLTIAHAHFDIRLIKLAIEQHTDNEVDEKETVLKLSVNDCELSDDEVEEIEHHKEKARAKKEREAQEKAKELSGQESKPNFTVMRLNLDENGEELLDALDKKQPGLPRLVYVQKDNGHLDYVFLKTIQRS